MTMMQRTGILASMILLKVIQTKWKSLSFSAYRNEIDNNINEQEEYEQEGGGTMRRRSQRTWIKVIRMRTKIGRGRTKT
jgi:hypothetical protein